MLTLNNGKRNNYNNKLEVYVCKIQNIIILNDSNLTALLKGCLFEDAITQLMSSDLVFFFSMEFNAINIDGDV
jgi:hypothetical protein